MTIASREDLIEAAGLGAAPLGMLVGAEAYRRAPGLPPVRCAKLQHDRTQRCIFRCGYAAAPR